LWLGWEEVREEVEQGRQREADDVEVVAFDARDECGAEALDGVAAGSALPLVGGDVPVEGGRGRRAEVDLGDRDGGVGDLAVAGEGDRSDDQMRATGQARDVLARLGRIARLAEDVAVDGDERVGAQRQRARPRRSRWRGARGVRVCRGDERRDSRGLAARVLLGDGDRVAVRLLLDVRRADGEGNADLLEDRAPLRRRGSER
jgi:hypothetical protein